MIIFIWFYLKNVWTECSRNIPRTFHYLEVGSLLCSDIPLLPTFGRSLRYSEFTLFEYHAIRGLAVKVTNFYICVYEIPSSRSLSSSSDENSLFWSMSMETSQSGLSSWSSKNSTWGEKWFKIFFCKIKAQSYTGQYGHVSCCLWANLPFYNVNKITSAIWKQNYV